MGNDIGHESKTLAADAYQSDSETSKSEENQLLAMFQSAVYGNDQLLNRLQKQESPKAITPRTNVAPSIDKETSPNPFVAVYQSIVYGNEQLLKKQQSDSVLSTTTNPLNPVTTAPQHVQTDDTSPNPPDEEPLFSIGIIADPQYADADDGQNYKKTRTRRYRHALTVTQNAVRTWNDEKKCKVRPSVIMSMGDIIDGLCKKKHSPATSVTAMETILAEFSKFVPNVQTKQLQSDSDGQDTSHTTSKRIGFPYFHNCVGNHEMYNFNRQELSKYQKSQCIDNGDDPADYIFYYSFSPFPGHVFIVLDAFVISNIGYSYCDNKHPNYTKAVQLLDEYNPNVNKNKPPKPTEAMPDSRRFAQFNGGFGEKQLKWLEAELKKARERGDKVFIFSHVPLVSTHKKYPYAQIAWDYKECKAIVNQYDDVVKAFFAGHAHDGDKVVDTDHGIVHRTFEGVIESDEGTDCFATVYFYEDKLFIEGHGKVKSGVYEI